MPAADGSVPLSPPATERAAELADAPDAPRAGSAAATARALSRSRGLRLLAWGAILLAAAALRFHNLAWGTEPIFDEVMYWRVPLSSFVGFDPERLRRWSLIYPTLFGSLAGLTVRVAHELGYLAHPLRDLPGAIVVARGVSAAAGVASVVLVGVLARRIESRTAGLLAAAFLAVVPIEAMQTHYVSVDVLHNVFLVLALIAGCALVERERRVWALLGGVAAGFAFGSKYSGILALAAPGWAILEVGFRRRSLRRTVTLGAVALAGFAIAVPVSCPLCVLDHEAMLGALQIHTANSFSSALSSYGGNLSPHIGWYARPYLYQLVAGLPFALGWPLYLLSLAGIVAAVIRHRPTDRVVLATLLAFFVVVAGSPVVYPRYLLPLVPCLVVCAALLVVRGARRRPAWIVVAAAVWLYGFALSWSLVSRYSHDQQAAIAAWAAEQNARCAPQGPPLVVGYPAGPYFSLGGPLAAAGVTRVSALPGKWLEASPDLFIVPEWLAINIDLERLYQGDLLAADLARLHAPDGPYEPVARWSSTYLQKGLYTWLDPSFAASLEQGELGFTVHAKKSLSCVERRLPLERAS